MVILDNAGLLLAGLFRPISTGAKTVTGIKRQDNGALFNTSCYQTETNSTIFNAVSVKQAQVGQGSTPAVRDDFDIETPFVGGPEASRANSLAAGYNSVLGKINIATTISPTAGPGTITEVCKFVSFRDNTGGSTNRIVCLMRDIVSPGKSFIIGQAIALDHEVQI